MVNVRYEAGEESQWVLVVPALKGCFGGSQSADNRPLYGRASADRRKFHCKLTDLGTLCPFWWDQPMDLDLAKAKERGLLLVQGPAGPAIVKDKDED